MRLVREDVVIGQLGHLACRSFDQALLAEADAHAPQPGQALDILAPLVVIDIDAGAAIDDDRTDAFVPPQIGRGMDLVGDIFALQGIGSHGGGDFLVAEEGSLSRTGRKR